MLTSYIKLAWKVLGRRKFFTFISLFGVGFTLMVLVVSVAVVDHAVGAHAPEVYHGRTLTVQHVRLHGGGSSSSSEVGPRFVTDYLRDLPGVERLSYFTNTGNRASGRFGGSFALKLTDGAYWKVMRFDFLEGGPFDDDDVRARRMVAVVSRATADKQLGEGPALGKTIELDAQRYQVVGVVKDVSPLRGDAFADVWAPLTTEKGASPRPELLGGGTALLLLRDRAAIPLVKQTVRERLRRYQPPNPRRLHTLKAPVETDFENTARDLLGEDTEDVDYGPRLVAALALLAACFLLLPTVNLVNLNVSRILERASEIGVRKSFGATRRALVGQFLVENLVLTAVGTAVGIAAALLVLAGLSDSALFPHAELRINPRVAGVGVLLALLFGVISGVYPAWRMSRLHPVSALRGGER
jgi:putative ABC transport system permease protein